MYSYCLLYHSLHCDPPDARVPIGCVERGKGGRGVGKAAVPVVDCLHDMTLDGTCSVISEAGSPIRPYPSGVTGPRGGYVMPATHPGSLEVTKVL